MSYTDIRFQIFDLFLLRWDQREKCWRWTNFWKSGFTQNRTNLAPCGSLSPEMGRSLPDDRSPMCAMPLQTPTFSKSVPSSPLSSSWHCSSDTAGYVAVEPSLERTDCTSRMDEQGIYSIDAALEGSARWVSSVMSRYLECSWEIIRVIVALACISVP